MAARNAIYQGMKLHGKTGSNISSLSDDEEAVHSGSATGFSDVDETHIPRPMKRAQNLFDPVTTILDKIDAELVSLTRSQSSTATDSTVVKRPSSHLSSDHGRRDESSDLSISQLNLHRGNFSPHSSDRDTGLGTGASSFQSDTFPVKRSSSPTHRTGSSEFLTGASGHSFGHSEEKVHGLQKENAFIHDKSRHREPAIDSSMEAKQVDDKFREIMQKRKGFLDHLRVKGSDTEDAQTIRTEDFVEKFEDTFVYSSDEAEKMKSVDTDLSDGGSDTDTLQQKLASLTRTTLPDGSPIGSRPVSIKTLSFEPQQPRRKLMPSVESKGMKDHPPIYPKSTPPPLYPKPKRTSTLPRPGTRSPIKLTAGQMSDAESVMTEDFESNFHDMLMPESDVDNPINDPIHTRVKELLKATAKYKPKTEPYNKQKQRVKISPPNEEPLDKGDDSDNTICSDKEDDGMKRLWPNATWDTSKLAPRYMLDDERCISQRDQRHFLSGPALSVADNNSQFSVSLSTRSSSINSLYLRQVSSSSATTSTTSDYPESSNFNSGSTSASESVYEDIDSALLTDVDNYYKQFEVRQFIQPLNTGKKSSTVRNVNSSFNSQKGRKNDGSHSNDRGRNINIIEPEDGEEYPFAKYTFNKKQKHPDKNDLDSGSDSSDTYTMRIHNRFIEHNARLKGPKKLVPTTSSSSLLSSFRSSISDPFTSFDESNTSECPDYDWTRPGLHMPHRFPKDPGLMSGYPGGSGDFTPPTLPSSSEFSKLHAEQILNWLGVTEYPSFLPERFLHDWIQKVIRNQQMEFNKRMSQSQGSAPCSCNFDEDSPPSCNILQYDSNPNLRMPMDHAGVPVSQYPPYRYQSDNRKRFRRSQSVSPFIHKYGSMHAAFDDEMSKSFTSCDLYQSTSGKVDHPEQAMSSSLQMDAKRTKLFNRQKSLPFFLETLCEEDELKSRSQSSSLEARDSKLSHFKHFLDGEETCSSSPIPSEHTSTSESSDRIYINTPAKHFELKHSDGTDSSDELPVWIQPDSYRKADSLNVPSIIVSEKDYHENSMTAGNKITDENSLATAKWISESDNLSVVAGYGLMRRPTSPTPDKDHRDDNSQTVTAFSEFQFAVGELASNLEIEEILDASENAVKEKSTAIKITNITTSVGATSNNMEITTTTTNQKTDSSFQMPTKHKYERKLSDSSQLLQTHAVDQDVKLLCTSPSSLTSTVSPIPMSPITVIEANKLDNQNDSVDTEENVHKETDMEQCFDNHTDTDRFRSIKSSVQLNNHEQVVYSAKSQPNLSLTPNVKSSQESMCVLLEDKASQASDCDGLFPIITLSDICQMFHKMFQQIPAQSGGLYYRARDEAIQCDIDTSGNDMDVHLCKGSNDTEAQEKSTQYWPNTDIGNAVCSDNENIGQSLHVSDKYNNISAEVYMASVDSDKSLTNYVHHLNKDTYLGVTDVSESKLKHKHLPVPVEQYSMDKIGSTNSKEFLSEDFVDLDTCLGDQKKHQEYLDPHQGSVDGTFMNATTYKLETVASHKEHVIDRIALPSSTKLTNADISKPLLLTVSNLNGKECSDIQLSCLNNDMLSQQNNNFEADRITPTVNEKEKSLKRYHSELQFQFYSIGAGDGCTADVGFLRPGETCTDMITDMTNNQPQGHVQKYNATSVDNMLDTPVSDAVYRSSVEINLYCNSGVKASPDERHDNNDAVAELTIDSDHNSHNIQQNTVYEADDKPACYCLGDSDISDDYAETKIGGNPDRQTINIIQYDRSYGSTGGCYIYEISDGGNNENISRSLDFDTVGMKRSLLKRTSAMTSSKSVDTGTTDIEPSLSVATETDFEGMELFESAKVESMVEEYQKEMHTHVQSIEHCDSMTERIIDSDCITVSTDSNEEESSERFLTIEEWIDAKYEDVCLLKSHSMVTSSSTVSSLSNTCIDEIEHDVCSNVVQSFVSTAHHIIKPFGI